MRYKGYYIVFLALTFLLLSSCYNKYSRQQVLKIYNWADYIDDGVLEEFQEYYREQTGEEI